MESLIKKPRNRFAGTTEFLAVGAEARSLDREHKSVRCLVAPLGPTRRFERGIIGSVYLDGRQSAAGEFEFTFLREAFRIEDPAPRFVSPAADSDPNSS